jgi:hypothetical protein
MPNKNNIKQEEQKKIVLELTENEFKQLILLVTFASDITVSIQKVIKDVYKENIDILYKLQEITEQNEETQE